jgi:hypothetical protein
LHSEQVEIYFKLFGHIDSEVLVTALERLLLTSRFEPKPADIAEAIAAVWVPEDRLPPAHQAFKMAFEPSVNLKALPPAVRAARECFFTTEADEASTTTLRSQFTKAYELEKYTRITKLLTPPDAHERQNAIRSEFVPPKLPSSLPAAPKLEHTDPSPQNARAILAEIIPGARQ